MIPGIGKLISLDERLHHQLVDTFATIRESDLSWTEKIWATLPRKDGKLQIDFGLGRYHNRNVMDGFAGISRGREQWTVRASRELAPDPEATAVGPLRYEVLEPLRKVRFVLERNDIVPLRFDVVFDNRMPAFFEDRHHQRDKEAFRIVSDVIRYHQAGSISGWIEIDGKREDIRSEDWFGFRDHSWGVRLDVGAHPTDLRSGGDFGDAAFAKMSFVLNWSPMVLQKPDGSLYAYHFYLQQRDNKTFYLSAYLNRADGEQERIARVRPELRYDDRTRRLQGGRLHFDMLAGGTRTVEVEVAGESGFHLGPALYLGFDGKKHGMWRGPLHVDGEKIADTLDVTTLKRIHQLRDCIIKVREGDASGNGIFESIVMGDNPELGLTQEASFV
jgi:hypothetical protein